MSSAQPPSDAAAAAAAAAGASPDSRKLLKEAIEATLWKIDEIESSLANYDGDGDLLAQRISDLHSSLGNLAQPQIREGAAVDVPVELLAALDDGLAPDAFIVQVFRRANRSNQLSKGKAAAVAALKDALLSEAAVKFPEAARAYKEVISSEASQGEEKKN